MIDSLGKLLIDPLAERWKSAAIGGSLVLWLFLAALVLFTRDTSGRRGSWPDNCPAAKAAIRLAWCSLPADGKAGATLVGLVAVIIATAFLTRALAPAVLRLVQGEDWRTLWWRLPAIPPRVASRYRRIHGANSPSDKFGGVRPTRVGNRFAALAERVQVKFGYELGIVWDVLVASLPPEARESLASASRAVLLACQNLLLGCAGTLAAIFVIPGGGARPVIPLVLALVTVCLWRALAGTVDDYCDAIMTALILYRDSLYTALAEAPPQPGNDVPKRGAELSDKLRDIIR